MKSKWMLAGAVTVLAMLMLASCGESAVQPESSGTTPATSAPAESVTEAGQTTPAVTTPAETAPRVIVPPDSEVAEAVHVNQIGYYPGSVKRAVVAGGGRDFSVVDATTGVTVYEGKVEKGSFGTDTISGEVVCFADFSDFATPGQYYLSVDGAVYSYPFTISDDVYAEVTRGILHSWYFLRCGTELTTEHAGEFAHAACHTSNEVLWREWETGGAYTPIDAAGGWHDAGDYSKWVTSGSGGILKMFLSYQIAPDLFDDSTSIPESGNGVPDILDEARWEIEWMLKMQAEDGGVYNMIFPEFHANFEVMPEDDSQLYYVYPVSCESTANLAQVCAEASRLYRAYDSAFADTCLAAAKAAQSYLEANPDLLPYGQYGYTNGYGSLVGSTVSNLAEMRFGAALELYLSTGDTHYQDVALTYLTDVGSGGGYFDSSASSFAYYSAIAGNTGVEVQKKIVNLLKDRLTTNVKNLKKNAYQSGYGLPLNTFWRMSNTLIARDAAQMGLAMLLLGHEGYDKTVQICADYLLGCNPLQLCWITGFGSNSVQNLHSRMGPLSGRFASPAAGFMPFGAGEYQYQVDVYPALPEYLPPETPAMRCYIQNDPANYVMTEFTESSQGCPLLLLSILYALNQNQ